MRWVPQPCKHHIGQKVLPAPEGLLVYPDEWAT